MIRIACSCLALAVSLAPAVAGDLDYVMAERNLEKRSERAWKNAGKALDEARSAFQKGDLRGEERALAEVEESVRLTKQSLDDSGKDPRRNSKYFKRAEIGLRNLLRRLDTFLHEHGVEDRERVRGIMQKTSAIREEILAGIMGKRS